MPTKKRAQFIPAAIDAWRRQTYQNKELVILDEGPAPIKNLVPKNKRIKYHYLDKSVTCGEKRNLVNALAAGKIIAHWDDDDFSGPGRLAYQVNRLLQTGRPLTGFSGLWFWDTIKKRAMVYMSVNPCYIVGTSFCYLKELWQSRPFEDKQKSTDNGFIKPLWQKLDASRDMQFMVARIHGSHTSSKDNISQAAKPKDLPAEFWQNEKLINYD